MSKWYSELNRFLRLGNDEPSDADLLRGSKESYCQWFEFGKPVRESKMKQFSKADLRTGMIAETRNGTRYMVVLDHCNGSSYFMRCDDYMLHFGSVNNDLTSVRKQTQWDIVRVYEKNHVGFVDSFDARKATLLWERKEHTLMTAEEVKERMEAGEDAVDLSIEAWERKQKEENWEELCDIRKGYMYSECCAICMDAKEDCAECKLAKVQGGECSSSNVYGECRNAITNDCREDFIHFSNKLIANLKKCKQKQWDIRALSIVRTKDGDFVEISEVQDVVFVGKDNYCRNRKQITEIIRY